MTWAINYITDFDSTNAAMTPAIPSFILFRISNGTNSITILFIKTLDFILYNKIDKTEMIKTSDRQLIRYLYVLELIAEVVLNTEEDKLFGTKINKNIREKIDDYVFLIREERKNVARTGIGIKKTWTYTLCNSESLEVEDNEEETDE